MYDNFYSRDELKKKITRELKFTTTKKRLNMLKCEVRKKRHVKRGKNALIRGRSGKTRSYRQ